MLPLSIVDKKIVHEVTETFLYYARAFDPTMLTALGSIAAQQVKPTEHTMKKVKQLSDYVTTHPDAILGGTAQYFFIFRKNRISKNLKIGPTILEI